MATVAAVELSTVTTQAELDALGGEWDELVRAMPRPSPFLLHGWISEWWRAAAHAAAARSRASPGKGMPELSMRMPSPADG